MTATHPVLRVRGLRKVFGDTVALRAADLEVRAGEIHALLGENGAGKSTLIKILAGVYPPDGGTIELGEEEWPHGTRPKGRAGVAFIHQDPVVFPDLSVAENIAALTAYPLRRGLIWWREVYARAEQVLARVDVTLDVYAPIASLPIAMRTMVAIAAALQNDASMLILDEPTASLAAREVDTLFVLLSDLRTRGIAILLVTHRIDEVVRMCDRVTILRDGSTVRSDNVSALSERELVALIVGKEASAASPETPRVSRGERLRVVGLVGESVPGPVTFTLHDGEVLGLTGTLEAGHHGVGEILYGLSALSRGELRLDGTAYVPSGPRRALAQGIRYLPADRNRMGLAAHLSLQENLFLNPSGRTRLLAPSTWIGVGTDRERRAAAAVLERFDVRPPLPRVEVAMLSGGNAQKLLLARCFAGNPRLVILTEPTAGVDVGARASIYDIIRNEAAAGVGIVVISSDFPEVEALCDRCLVFRRGRIARELAGDSATVHEIASAAL